MWEPLVLWWLRQVPALPHSSDGDTKAQWLPCLGPGHRARKWQSQEVQASPASCPHAVTLGPVPTGCCSGVALFSGTLIQTALGGSLAGGL